MDESVATALDAIPAGRWGVAVSGGADSTALLVLLRERRPSLPLVVLHYNHQLRGDESDRDETFVRLLAGSLGLPFVVRRDSDEPTPGLPCGTTHRMQHGYRALRLSFFRQCVAAQQLDGVLLAHHFDDQVETVFHRLLRGSGLLGLTGMKPDTVVAGVRLLRPLLKVFGGSLRDALRDRGITWCEDSSNRQGRYTRNRVRRLLREDFTLQLAIADLQCHASVVVQWLEENTPRLPAEFSCDQLADLPDLQARFGARRWLLDAGVPIEEINEDACDRLVKMSRDAATPAVEAFPGVTVYRSGRRIADRPPHR